jgi:hypothetical protein
MTRQPIGLHGPLHGSTGGSDFPPRLAQDPIPADWVYVGSGGTAPAFQNGWDNMGGSKAPLRFAFVPGFDSSSGQPQLVIEGSITGGTASTTIFTLPFGRDYDTFPLICDGTGTPMVLTVKQSGDVVDGFA